MANRSLRRSNSISRETPIRIQRVRNWKMALVPATASSSAGVGQQLVACDAAVQVVDGAADDQREENPDAVVAQHAERADPEGLPVLAQIRS